MAHLIPPNTSAVADDSSSLEHWTNVFEAMEWALDAGEREGSVPLIETRDLFGPMPPQLHGRAERIAMRIVALHSVLEQRRDVLADDLASTHRPTHGWQQGAPPARHLDQLA